MDVDFSLQSYDDLLKLFLSTGYKFEKYRSQNLSDSTNLIILRHDVDFNPYDAQKIAEIEYRHEISSTYFFMLKSPLYNLLSPQCKKILYRIADMGHDIALHFDPQLYLPIENEKLESYLLKEIELLRIHYPFANKDIFSFHRAGRLLNTLDLEFMGSLEHTYQKNYFVPGQYFSDSRAKWGKDGNPLQSDAFKNRRGMQLVTHPMWWSQRGSNAIEKLAAFLESLKLSNIDHLEESIVTFSLQVLREIGREQ